MGICLRRALLAALMVLAVGVGSLALPGRPAGAATWTPPEGLPAGFPAPPSNLDNTNFKFSPRIAKKGDVVTITSTGGYIDLLKVWSQYPTEGTLSPAGPCSRTANSCSFNVGATTTSWQGWLVLGAMPGSFETGPYDALAIIPSGPAVSPPSAPTSVTAAGGKGKATVSWKAPSSNGGAAIQGYQVSSYIAGVFQTTKYYPSAATSQVFTPLANGVPVQFKVAAVNSAGAGALSTLTAPVVPPFGSAASFVDRMGRDLLGRAPTTAESTAEVNKLRGGANPGVVVADFRRSADAVANVDPTTRLYFAYLQRVPDKSGLQYWVGKKRGGMLISKISQTFAQSSEFTNKYGSLSNRQFVTRIYTDVLGRTADPSGVDYWTGQLDRKAKNRGQVMVGFSESSEYKGKKATSVDVAVTWISLLQAKPTQAEFDDSVDDLDAGRTLDAFAFAILKDARFANRF